LFSGPEAEDAIRKLFESLRGADSAQSAAADEESGDGYGEAGFDDFLDENGNDTWPKN